jgi:hypothetical protein
MAIGFSLNDRVSFSMQVIGGHVGETKNDEADLVDSSGLDIVSLRFAVTVLGRPKIGM